MVILFLFDGECRFNVNQAIELAGNENDENFLLYYDVQTKERYIYIFNLQMLHWSLLHYKLFSVPNIFLMCLWLLWIVVLFLSMKRLLLHPKALNTYCMIIGSKRCI